MKKIIIFLFSIFIISLFFIPFQIIEAADKEEGDACKTQSDCSPSDESDYPGGLNCHPYKNICYDVEKLGKKDIGWNELCLNDQDCAGTSLCNQFYWECKPAGNKNDQCKRSIECISKICDLTEKSSSQNYCIAGKKYREACNPKNEAKECEEGLECKIGTELCLKYNTSKDGSLKSGAKEGEDCFESGECLGDYLYCTADAGVSADKGKCQKKISTGSKCERDTQCLQGKCTKTVEKDGKETGICERGQQANEECDIKEGSTLKCDAQYVCKTNSGSTKGVCSNKAPTVTAEQLKWRELTSEINIQCDRAIKRGLFTTGVATKCLNCGDCSTCDIIIIIANVINFAFSILGAAAVLAIVISGIMYIISGGNEETTKKAKKALTSAIIGIVIVLTAWILINSLMQVLGYNKGSWFSPSCSGGTNTQPQRNEPPS